MELADKIYRLRTEKKFSQGDLADALEVSRQSVSKWETGASVPELDKLVKLSELFGVTLDELVRDAAPEPQKPEPNCSDKGERVVVLHAVPVRKLVGTIILAVGGLLADCRFRQCAFGIAFLSAVFDLWAHLFSFQTEDRTVVSVAN